MKLSVGTKVRWESAAGVKRGTIAEISLDKNAAGETVPWITIEQEHGRVASHHRQNYTVHFCATDSNLKVMRVSQVV